MIQLKFYLETKETGLDQAKYQKQQPGWIYLLNDYGKITKTKQRFHRLDQIPDKIRECLKKGGVRERVTW